MKTDETPAPAANLTVADLSKALSQPKTAPAPDETETETDKSTDAETTREPSPGEEAEPEADESTDLSQTDATDDGETGTEEAAGEETTEAETDEAPPSVAETVRQQLETELKPLIAELNQVGAKGALQVLLKRLPKLTDQRDTERNRRLSAEHRVSELETELQTAQSERAEAAETPRSRGIHPAVAKLSGQIAEVDSFLTLFKANPDGVELPDGRGGTHSLSAEDVADHLERLRDRRTELVAEKSVTQQQVRQAYQAAYQQVHAKAAEWYPWLKNPQAPEQARLKQLLQAVPGLKDNPDYELIVADYFRGKAAREQALATQAKPAARKAPPARVPTKVQTDAPAAKSGPADAKAKADREVKAAEAQFAKTGKREDLARLEAAKTRARRLGS